MWFPPSFLAVASPMPPAPPVMTATSVGVPVGVSAGVPAGAVLLSSVVSVMVVPSAVSGIVTSTVPSLPRRPRPPGQRDRTVQDRAPVREVLPPHSVISWRIRTFPQVTESPAGLGW